MEILVLDHYAAGYEPYLRDLADSVRYATEPTGLASRYDVLLAQPDFAATYLREGGQVDWIQSTWAGVRPLAEEPVSRYSVVTGVKSVFGPQIAEYVFTYALEEIRRPASLRAAQADQRWIPELPGTLADRHMLVVGTGDIGRHVAMVGAAFGLRVTGVSRSGTPVAGFERVLPVTGLSEAVADADYVVLVLPDTEATAGLINADVFAAMACKPLLFNVGRGNSLDDEALLQALSNGTVRGAVLDVFDEEPLPPAHPLWSAPAVTITPHVAAVSFPRDIARLFLANLKKYKAGQPLDFVLDLARGY